MNNERIIIYSVLPRLWANFTNSPVQHGTIEQNGSGKLSAWDTKALDYVKSLGATHIWFIGLLEHATAQAFEGIEADPAELVKGIAGSPYAVKDYYDIAPELADNPQNRLKEFDALVERVHASGLKLMMDFIPNHVARTYHSDAKPNGTSDLGAEDYDSLGFDTRNNFYYLQGEELRLPTFGTYHEYPAKATGNDCFTPTPSHNDWYETIKLNYGVNYMEGGQKDFNPIPNTWHKMLEILHYWAKRGVDGFRCDMAEMVPSEFWAWALPQLREKYPLIFLAEIYQPERYTEYITAGFDYLYDKVGVYDSLRAIVRGELSASQFDPTRDAVGELQKHMCYFLENHDEQRFTSPYFAGDSQALRPALAVMALCGGQPYLHYFAGELGEQGMDEEGYSGLDGRTSIFDYWSLSSLCRLGSDFLGSKLSPQEQDTLHYHRLILKLAGQHIVFGQGGYHGINYLQGEDYDHDRVLSFVRYTEGYVALVVASFADEPRHIKLRWSEELLQIVGISANTALSVENLVNGEKAVTTLSPWVNYRVDLAPKSVEILLFSPLH